MDMGLLSTSEMDDSQKNARSKQNQRNRDDPQEDQHSRDDLLE
jgi:hypothetical protein